jgi:hypothetical protein
MLHRYIFTLSLILTFGLGQLGLLAHDVSHINQHLALSLETSLSVLDGSGSVISSHEDTASDKASNSISQNTQASTNEVPTHKPLVIDQHTCEKCVGFADLTFVLQQASILVNQANAVTLQSNAVKVCHYERISLHPLARAPPYFLA